MTQLKIMLVIVLLISIFSISYGQDKPPAIEVFGTASISVVPDIMKWTVSIQHDNDILQDAKNKHDAALLKVLEVLRQNGIEENKIKTSGISMVKRLYKYGEEKKFNVYNTIWFTLDNIEKYDVLTNELVKIEDVYVTSTDMEYSKAIETRIQVRTNALNAAKEKAMKMAEVLGVTVGKPLLITEAPVDYWSPVQSNVNEQMRSTESSNGSGLFNEGMLNIETRVKVVFELK